MGVLKIHTNLQIDTRNDTTRHQSLEKRVESVENVLKAEQD